MAQAVVTTPMQIKALNWKAPSFSNFWTHSAWTPFGTYSIERTKAHYQIILEGPGGVERRIDRPTRDIGFARQLAQRDFDKRTLSLLAPAAPVASGVICTNCGSTRTDSQLKARRLECPTFLSCCPERNAVPVYNITCTGAAEDEPEYHAQAEADEYWLQAAE